MNTRLQYAKIAFLDLDAFYASVEQRDDPTLPACLLVGKKNGPVLSASYAARSYRVHNGMPMQQALERCPEATRCDPDLARYRRAATQVRVLCAEYTDLIQPAAPGQFYLDITYNKPDIPFAHRLAQLLKADIRRATGLGTSVGIGPGKFVARRAAHHQRPNGLKAVAPEEVVDFLADLPLSQLPGAGRTTLAKLKAHDISTAGQLAALPSDQATALLGPRGLPLWELAHGRQDDPVTPPRAQRIEQEQAFPAPLYDSDEILHPLRQLTETLAARLQRHDLSGHTLTLEVRYANGRTARRSHTFPTRIAHLPTLWRQTQDLLQQTRFERQGVRRLALVMAGFEDPPINQLDLFTPQ